jgi:hypothetical protein
MTWRREKVSRQFGLLVLRGQATIAALLAIIRPEWACQFIPLAGFPG